MDMPTKKCSGFCGMHKPLDQFAISRASKDGHQSYCRECCKFYREYRELERKDAKALPGKPVKVKKAKRRMPKVRVSPAVIEMDDMLWTMLCNDALIEGERMSISVVRDPAEELEQQWLNLMSGA